MTNPWKVSSIHVFNYFCCPECVFRSQEINSFEAHAVQNHPLASVLFGQTIDDLELKNDIEEIKYESIEDFQFNKTNMIEDNTIKIRTSNNDVLILTKTKSEEKTKEPLNIPNKRTGSVSITRIVQDEQEYLEDEQDYLRG